MRRGIGSIVVAGGVISMATAATRLWQLPVRELAATPETVGDGRIWLLATSALLADRPAFASILGFLIVGVAAVRICGPRVAWVAAAAGHVLSAAVVYLAVGLVRLSFPSTYESVMRLPDYGTSAMIAGWIGAVACVLWLRRRRLAAVGLCIVSALAGWYFKGTLTVLDSEHAVALAVGVAAMRYRPLRAAAAARWRIEATRGDTETPPTARGRPTAGVPVNPA